MSNYGRHDLDQARAVCRNGVTEIAELAERIRGLRFRRKHFDLKSGYGQAFTALSLAMNSLDSAAKQLTEAAEWFYSDDPDMYWMDDNGKLHYIENDEEESE